MGLDMYLYAVIKAPAGSAVARIVEENLTDEHRKSFDPEYSGDGFAYISGWGWGNGPDALYGALCLELGITPPESSPHFSVGLDGEGGYIIQPTLYYWRKANAIHNFFVEKAQDGVDDCRAAPVYQQTIADLIERCEEIVLDHSKANLLEPTGGFFFGSTERDEWYYEDIKRTAEELSVQVGLAAPKASHFLYRSSW